MITLNYLNERQLIIMIYSEKVALIRNYVALFINKKAATIKFKTTLVVTRNVYPTFRQIVVLFFGPSHSVVV